MPIIPLSTGSTSYPVPFVYPFLQGKETTSPLILTVPGSKSITNRALLLATLANGTSILRGALFSDDSHYFLQCIKDLGFSVSVCEEDETVTVTGLGGTRSQKRGFHLCGKCRNSGRFLTAYLGVAKGTFHLNASEQMKNRPMAPLLSTLERLGTQIIL